LKSIQVYRWQFKVLAILLPFLLLFAAEAVLLIFSIIPPDDPLLFHIKTQERYFSPFIETVDGRLMIKPDWCNNGEILAAKRGSRPGRLYCDPGFRPCEIRKTKLKNSICIFVLGGSTVFGLLVGERETFPAVLEMQLKPILKPREIEVINLGCPGLSSGRVLNLVDSILGLKPDLIIIYSGHNEFLHGNLSGLHHFSFVKKLKANLLLFSNVFGWTNFLVSSIIKSREYDYLREEIAAIKAGKILTSDLEAVLRKNPEETRVKLVDLLPSFRGKLSFESQKRLFIDHCHLTKYGHRLVAEYIQKPVLDVIRRY